MPAEGDAHYSLGTFGDPPSMNLFEEIDEADYRAITEAANAIGRLAHSFTYTLVERNFLDLRGLHQFVTILLSLGRNFANPNRPMLGEAVMTSTVNWLTSMRLHVDHAETRLKTRFGKDSSEVAAFKSATANAFDGHVGYRFSYKLRNYVQHCGLPLSRISITAAAPGSIGVQEASLLLDRDDLLSLYQEWGPVKKDLRAMDQSFELLPLADDAMEGLRSIARAETEIDLDEALARLPDLRRALDRIEGSHELGAPAVFRHTGDPSKSMQVTPQLLPTDAVAQLEAVATGTTPRATLFEKATPTVFPIDPQTVAERFHADSRGVQVLSAWFAEGGGTERFTAVVNDILEKDQGPDALIVGLVNVSTTLAHMTAGALGASAPGLLAGMLDIYGQYDA